MNKVCKNIHKQYLKHPRNGFVTVKLVARNLQAHSLFVHNKLGIWNASYT